MSLVQQLESIMKESGISQERGMARNGLALARVINVNDEEGFNRVQCLPVGAPDNEVTDWCYCMAPMGGKGCGVYFPPQVDDLVVLAYLDDDPHRPVVLGSIWNTEVTPPFTIKEGKVEDYAIRTPKAIDLTFHDEDEKQTVTLTMPSGTVLRFDDGEQTVTLQDKDGKNALKMNFKSGEAELTSEKKLTLSAGETSITLESSGNLTLQCNGKLSAQGASIEEKAKGQMTLQGATTQVKGDGTLELSGGGSASLKGGIVKIN